MVLSDPSLIRNPSSLRLPGVPRAPLAVRPAGGGWVRALGIPRLQDHVVQRYLRPTVQETRIRPPLVALEHDSQAGDLAEVVEVPNHVDGARRLGLDGGTAGLVPMAVAQETEGPPAGRHVILDADQVAGLQGEHYPQNWWRKE